MPKISTFNGFGVEALKVQLALGIRSKHVLYIEGPPGAGKTRIVEQVAENNGFTPLTFIISQMLPEDLGGIVTSETVTRESLDGSGEETISRAKRLMPDVLVAIEDARAKHGKPVLAFFDEVNNGSQLMFGALMNLLLERCAAGYCVPEDTAFVAAGNPPETSFVAQDLPAPLYNRMARVEYDGPTFDEWENYALANDIHPAVLGFFKSEGGRVWLKDKADWQGKKSNPSPRSWEATSDVLKDIDALKESGSTLPTAARLHAIASRVGDEAARAMDVSLKWGDQLTPWKDIIKDPKKAKVPDDFVPAYMQAVALVPRVVDEKSIKAAITYAKRLPKEVQAVFSRGLQKSGKAVEFMHALDTDDLAVFGKRNSVGGDLRIGGNTGD